MSAIATQQAALSLTTDWQQVLSADVGRQLIQLQNNDAAVVVLYVFGPNPKDKDALRLPPGGGWALYDLAVPDGTLWMRATAATDAVVLLNS